MVYRTASRLTSTVTVRTRRIMPQYPPNNPPSDDPPGRGGAASPGGGPAGDFDAETVGADPSSAGPGADARGGLGAGPSGPGSGTAPAPPSPLPEKLGGYRVLGEIGRGGMGSVYSAVRVDDSFRKRVAIKVMRRGLDTEDMLARFELERQVLGAISHPNIARVFDAGVTPDGRPYFVMELVEGRPIDRYCDEHNLPLPARLELFRKVCGAVHVAHQNLVVHRDIKPANILVTQEGEPKLLDFGIAKLLNPEMAAIDPMTRPDQRLLTYEYASPEQVTGDPITTASDVYALGVLLYELLTGHRPYQIERRVHEEAVRVICSTEPERPSTAVSRAVTVRGPGDTVRTISGEEIARRREMQLARLKRRLSGDLDNIILMAMRKTPNRRYKSAEDLSSDIGRHLSGMTVVARSPTWDYRAGKFIRRHRAPVAAAALIAIALLAGLSAMTWQWRKAEAERARAEAAEAGLFERVEQLRRMAGAFDEIERDLDRTGASTAARLGLSRAVVRTLEGLRPAFEGDPTLRLELAAGYRRAGRLAAGPIRQAKDAMASLRRADELAGTLDAGQPGVRLERASIDLELSRVLERAGQPEEAALRAQSAAEGALAYADASDDPGAARRLAAEALDQLAFIRLTRGDLDDADRAAQRSLDLRLDLAERDPNEAENRLGLVMAYETVGRIAESRGDPERAIGAYDRAIALARGIVEADPGHGEALRRAAVLYTRRGYPLSALQRFDDAQASFARAQGILEGLLAEDPFNGRSFEELAQTYEGAGDAWFGARDWDRALRAYRAFLSRAETALERDPANRQRARMVALAHKKAADTLRRRGDDPAAAEAFRTALAMNLDLLDADPSNRALLSDVLWIGYYLGGVLQRLGDEPGAERAYSRGFEAGERLESMAGFEWPLPVFAGGCARGVARGAVRAGDGARAVALYARAQQLHPRETWEPLRDEAAAFRLLGDPEAEADRLRRAIAAVDGLEELGDDARAARDAMASRLEELTAGDG